jgi:hypothetical protein
MLFCILDSLVTSSEYYKKYTPNAIETLQLYYPYNNSPKSLFLYNYIIYEGSKHGYVMTIKIFLYAKGNT